MKILKLGQSLGGSNAPSAAFKNLYSLDFDGVDDFVDLGNNSSLRPDIAGGISVSVWCKWVDVASAAGIIFSNSSNASSFNGLYVDKSSTGKISLTTGSGGGFSVSTRRSLLTDSVVVTNNTWHHIVAVFTDATSSNWKVYVDGSDKASSTSGTGGVNVYTTDDAFIAKRVISSVQFNYGNMDEFSFWDKALSSAEVTAIYNGGAPTDLTGESNLIGYWRNGDPNGTAAFPTITDDSSNSNNGTMTNMASGDIVTDVPT